MTYAITKGNATAMRKWLRALDRATKKKDKAKILALYVIDQNKQSWNWSAMDADTKQDHEDYIDRANNVLGI